jgi:hypothetical protein
MAVLGQQRHKPVRLPTPKSTAELKGRIVPYKETFPSGSPEGVSHRRRLLSREAKARCFPILMLGVLKLRKPG